MQDNTPAAHGFTELVVDFEEMICYRWRSCSDTASVLSLM